jgi:hypothetical protein
MKPFTSMLLNIENVVPIIRQEDPKAKIAIGAVCGI